MKFLILKFYFVLNIAMSKLMQGSVDRDCPACPGRNAGPVCPESYSAIPLLKEEEIRVAIQSEFNLKPINELVILKFEEEQYCPNGYEFDVIVCHGRNFICEWLNVEPPISYGPYES